MLGCFGMLLIVCAFSLCVCTGSCLGGSVQRFGHALHLPTVVLDPGHGGPDLGHQSASSSEKEITLAFARVLTRRLQKHQTCNIVLTRTADIHTSERARIQVASNHYPTCFLSLHTAFSSNPNLRGIHVYYTPKHHNRRALSTDSQAHENSEALSDILTQHLKTSVVMADIAPEELHHSKTRELPCATVFICLGYQSHERESALLQSPHYLKSLANVVADGIEAFLSTLR